MEIDIDRIIESKLNLNGWLILYCLHSKNNSLLLNYIAAVGKIQTKVFDDLVKHEWLSFEGNSTEYTLDNISLTDKFSNVFYPKKSNALDFDFCYKQLKIHYPSKVVDQYGGVRPLHTDNERCRKLYANAIMKDGQVDEEKHSMILQCINYIVNNKTKSKSLGFMQLLPTFLYQKGWEPVESDVMKIIIEKGGVMKKEEGESGGFMDDV